MKAKVLAKFINVLHRSKQPLLSTNPKTGAQIDDGNWQFVSSYTRHATGETVELGEIEFRNLSRKGMVEAASEASAPAKK